MWLQDILIVILWLSFIYPFYLFRDGIYDKSWLVYLVGKEKSTKSRLLKIEDIFSIFFLCQAFSFS